MSKKDNIKTFIDELYSFLPKRICPTKKVNYNFIDEIWIIDLADMIKYKSLNNKGIRYIFMIIDIFSK